MRGSIRTRELQDGSKRYDCIWRAGGKQHWKTFQKKKDAETFLAETVVDVHSGAFVPVQPKTMADVFDTWLKNLDTRLKLGDQMKPSTANTYRSIVKKHLRPTFGRYRSDQLSAAVVAKWRHRMADKVAEGKLSRKTFNNVLTLLRSILGWAREPAQSYLSHDPLIGQKPLKLNRPEAEFLEDEDMKALLDAARESAEENAFVHLALFAGLRRGEVFGLQWGDIEWADGKHGGRVNVRRSVYQGTITDPKTSTSERVVDVPRGVLDALRRHRTACPPDERDFVFRTDKGTPTDPDNFYKRTFIPLRNRAALRDSIGIHTLRHTYASLLIRQNESPKYVSKQLGHASIQITMDTYGHLFESTSTKAMRRLNALIPEPKPALRVVGAE